MKPLLQNRYYLLEKHGGNISVRTPDKRVVIKKITCSACFKASDQKTHHFRFKSGSINIDNESFICKAEYQNNWFRISLILECSDYSPEIKTTIIYTWHGEPPEELINKNSFLKPEYISVDLHFPLSLGLKNLYLKNRTYRKVPPLFPVWLDKQGLTLGRKNGLFHIYHIPEVSSLLYRRWPHRLTIYADHAHDHRFVKASLSGEDIVYTDCSHTILQRDEEHRAVFRFYAGTAPEVQPLLWLHGQGHDASLIWTWHPDNSNLGSTLAVTFGTSEADTDSQPTGGFAAHGIPATMGVFYSTDNDQNISLTKHPDSDQYLKLIKRLHRDFGFEITPHSASSNISDKALADEALEYFASNFGNSNWIDHSGYVQRCTLSGDGTDNSSESYILDLLQRHGIKYAWNYGSELKYLPGFDFYDDSSGLDVLKTGKTGCLSEHTPIFWTHHSLLKHVKTWKTILLGRLRHFPVTGLQWLVFFKRNLPPLIRNHGVSIIHDYPCWSYRKKYSHGNGYFIRVSDAGVERYISDPDFNSLLADLNLLGSEKKLNCTTVKKFFDYITSLDELSFTFQDTGCFRLKNNNINEITAVLAFPAASSPKSENLQFIRQTDCLSLYRLHLSHGASTIISTH